MTKRKTARVIHAIKIVDDHLSSEMSEIIQTLMVAAFRNMPENRDLLLGHFPTIVEGWDTINDRSYQILEAEKGFEDQRDSVDVVCKIPRVPDHEFIDSGLGIVWATSSWTGDVLKKMIKYEIMWYEMLAGNVEEARKEKMEAENSGKNGEEEITKYE